VKSLAFVIATKDRPGDLRRMLQSLAAGSHRPDLVVIVDSSADPVRAIADEFGGRLRIDYRYHLPPSASAQRNAGVAAVPGEIDLIAFLDDDATVEPDAVERMLAFWESAPAGVGGCAFNLANHPEQAFARVKRWPILRTLGVYSGERGRVTRSGWQTLIGFAANDLEVEWLPSTAAVWRADILRSHRYDEFFEGYSYLEDLDFSYTIGSEWRLFVVAGARYRHFPSPIRHTRQYGFGTTEVRNRLYFVRKHGLSVPRCWLGLTMRMGLTLGAAAARLDSGALGRAIGNCSAMAAELARTPNRAALE
jgi:glycosyltransferase involved in cell wall biosynthesis